MYIERIPLAAPNPTATIINEINPLANNKAVMRLNKFMLRRDILC